MPASYESTAIRALLLTMARSLDLPDPATADDELAYLRLSRNRGRCVLWACNEASKREMNSQELMSLTVRLCEDVKDFPADSYNPSPFSS